MKNGMVEMLDQLCGLTLFLASNAQKFKEINLKDPTKITSELLGEYLKIYLQGVGLLEAATEINKANSLLRENPSIAAALIPQK